MTTYDVARLMRAHDLPDHEVDLVVDKAQARGIKPLTMWLWTQRFDVHTLAVVVAADLSHEQLIAHLADGTLPDLDELQVFAAINGLSTRSVVRRPRAIATRVARPAGSGGAIGAAPAAVASPVALPPIHDPGSWPYGPLPDPLDLLDDPVERLLREPRRPGEAAA